MTDAYESRAKRFLAGLEMLSRETGITVTACGCCNGIGLTELKPREMMSVQAGYYCTPEYEELQWRNWKTPGKRRYELNLTHEP